MKVEVELTVRVDVGNEFGAIGRLEQSSWQDRLRKRHLIRGDREITTVSLANETERPNNTGRQQQSINTVGDTYSAVAAKR